MKTQDFVLPQVLKQKRRVVYKGEVYECQGTLVMALETTCNLTKESFKAICVGRNENWSGSSITVVGSKMKCPIENYDKSK